MLLPQKVSQSVALMGESTSRRNHRPGEGSIDLYILRGRQPSGFGVPMLICRGVGSDWWVCSQSRSFGDLDSKDEIQKNLGKKMKTHSRRTHSNCLSHMMLHEDYNNEDWQ